MRLLVGRDFADLVDELARGDVVRARLAQVGQLVGDGQRVGGSRAAILARARVDVVLRDVDDTDVIAVFILGHRGAADGRDLKRKAFVAHGRALVVVGDIGVNGVGHLRIGARCVVLGVVGLVDVDHRVGGLDVGRLNALVVGGDIGNARGLHRRVGKAVFLARARVVGLGGVEGRIARQGILVGRLIRPCGVVPVVGQKLLRHGQLGRAARAVLVGDDGRRGAAGAEDHGARLRIRRAVAVADAREQRVGALGRRHFDVDVVGLRGVAHALVGPLDDVAIVICGLVRHPGAEVAVGGLVLARGNLGLNHRVNGEVDVAVVVAFLRSVYVVVLVVQVIRAGVKRCLVRDLCLGIGVAALREVGHVFLIGACRNKDRRVLGLYVLVAVGIVLVVALCLRVHADYLSRGHEVQAKVYGLVEHVVAAVAKDVGASRVGLALIRHIFRYGDRGVVGRGFVELVVEVCLLVARVKDDQAVGIDDDRGVARDGCPRHGLLVGIVGRGRDGCQVVVFRPVVGRLKGRIGLMGRHRRVALLADAHLGVERNDERLHLLAVNLAGAIKGRVARRLIQLVVVGAVPIRHDIGGLGLGLPFLGVREGQVINIVSTELGVVDLLSSDVASDVITIRNGSRLAGRSRPTQIDAFLHLKILVANKVCQGISLLGGAALRIIELHVIDLIVRLPDLDRGAGELFGLGYRKARILAVERFPGVDRFIPNRPHLNVGVVGRIVVGTDMIRVRIGVAGRVLLVVDSKDFIGIPDAVGAPEARDGLLLAQGRQTRAAIKCCSL